MKHVGRAACFQVDGLTLPARTPNATGNHPYYEEILRRTYEQMDAMLSYHSKIFVVQFVFQLHDYEATNRTISRFMASIRKRLGNRYGWRTACGWVREQNTGKPPHYHVVLIFNGHRVHKQYRIMKIVQEMAVQRDLPPPSFNRKAHMVRRSKPDTFFRAFEHLSYLAKVRTKGNRPRRTNDYSFSRLRPKSGHSFRVYIQEEQQNGQKPNVSRQTYS